MAQEVTLAKINFDITQATAGLKSVWGSINAIGQETLSMGQTFNKAFEGMNMSSLKFSNTMKEASKTVQTDFFNMLKTETKTAQANASSLSNIFQSLINKVKSFASTQSKAMGGAGGLVKNVLAGAGIGVGVTAGVAAAEALGNALKEVTVGFVEAADANELWMSRMTVLTGSSEGAERALKAVYQAAEHSVFSLNELKDAAGVIAKFGQDVKTTLPHVQNLALVMKTDLSSAAKTTGQILDGSGVVLRKLITSGALTIDEMRDLGVEYGKLGRGSELTATQINKIMGALDKKGMDIAAKQAEALKGQVQSLKNEWQIFSETLGTAVEPILASLVHEFLIPIGEWFVEHQNTIKVWAETIANTVKNVIEMYMKWQHVLYEIVTLGELIHLPKISESDQAPTPTPEQIAKMQALHPEQATRLGFKPPPKVGGADEAERKAKEKEAEETNQEIEDKLVQMHEKTVEEKMQEDLKYIESVKVGSAKQKEAIQDLEDLQQQKSRLALAALDQEISKLKTKGASDEEIENLTRAETALIQEQNNKLDQQVKMITDRQQKEQEHLKLEQDIKAAEQKLSNQRKDDIEEEKKKIQSLNELLKTQEKTVNDITDAIAEQKGEIAEATREWQKQVDASKQTSGTSSKKGNSPFGSLSDMSGGSSAFQMPSFGQVSPSSGPDLSKIESIEDIINRKKQEKQDLLTQFPELADAENAMKGTKGQIKEEEGKEKALQEVEVHVDGSKILNEQQLSAMVKDILDKITSAQSNRTNTPSQSGPLF